MSSGRTAEARLFAAFNLLRATGGKVSTRARRLAKHEVWASGSKA
jgi:hypothetical protein